MQKYLLKSFLNYALKSVGEVINSVMRGKTRHLRISLAIKKHESKIKYFCHDEYVK